MNLQAFFNESTSRLAQQGRLGVSEVIQGCEYMTATRHGCALGVMMTDEDLEMLGKLGMLGSSIGYLFVEKVPVSYLKEATEKRDRDFLYELQRLHDEWKSPVDDQSARIYSLGKYVEISQEQRDQWMGLYSIEKNIRLGLAA